MSAVPVVTGGGVQVPVISSVLSTGTAGLYQITIQMLPACLRARQQYKRPSAGRKRNRRDPVMKSRRGSGTTSRISMEAWPWSRSLDCSTPGPRAQFGELCIN